MPAQPLRRHRRRTRSPAAKTVQTIKLGKYSPVALTWSPTGHFLAAAMQHGTILLFSVQPHNTHQPIRPHPVRVLKGHASDVLHLSFSPSNFLASASMDRTVRLWHPQIGMCMRSLPHPDKVTSVAFNPVDPGVLLTTASDGQARLCRFSDRTVLARAETRTPLTTGVFLSDASTALGTLDGRLLHWRPQTATLTTADQLTTLPLDRRSRLRRPSTMEVPPLSTTATTSRGKRRVFITSADARIAELRDGEIVRHARAQMLKKKGMTIGAGVSPDGQFALLDGIGGVVRVAHCSTTEGKRREREISADVVNVHALSRADVTCAAFASEAAVKRCGRVDSARSNFLLAVGGDDRTLSIVEQEYA